MMMVLTRSSPVMIFLAGLAAAGPAQAVTYSTSEIMVYGATNVIVSGLNDHGVVTGSYQKGRDMRGFVASPGRVTELTPIHVPGFGKAYPFGAGVNDKGEVLANVFAGSTEYGATYVKGRKTSGFPFPAENNLDGSAAGYQAVALSRSGSLVLNEITLANPITQAAGSAISYVGKPGGLTKIGPPTGAAPNTSLLATAINAHDTVAGLVYAAYGIQPATQLFIAGPAGTQFFGVSGAATLGNSLLLNDLGQIAGVSIDTSGDQSLFFGRVGHFQDVALSHDSYNLSVVGLNDHGDIAIVFSDQPDNLGYQYLTVVTSSGEYYLQRWSGLTSVSVAGLNNHGDLAYTVSANGVAQSYLATCTGC